MADKKISQLTAATTPLAGTEVLPIVQSGSTVKVSAADITAGRAVGAASLTVDGAAVINENGGDADFRVEGDTDANLLFTDASTDRIGMGTNSPLQKLHVAGNARMQNSGADTQVHIVAPTDSYAPFVRWGVLGIRDSGILGFPVGDDALVYRSQANSLSTGTERFRISVTGDTTISTGNLVVGTADKGIADSAGTQQLYVNTTGVGVGMAPARKFDVSGVSRGGLTHRKGTYTPGDTTPSVSGVSYLDINNSSATSITNFTGAVEGQMLMLVFRNANTTITRNNAYLAGGVNFTSANNATLLLISDGTAWYEVCRSTTNS